jgi:cytochrome P450
MSDLSRLPYTEMVIKETMRLYPSAWIIGREATQDFELGGYSIKAGSSMLLSQWLKHRDERYFKSPEKFVPERWTSEETNNLPKFAYFPFGGGPRVCIGSSFAMMEAILALATITQQFRLTAQPNYVIKPFAAITLQPLGGVKLKVEKREIP